MEAFRIAIDFGSFALPWNALILVLAVAAATVLTGAIVKRRGMYRDLALDVCILCIPVGLIGGRLFSALSGRIAWSALLSLGEPALNLFGALLFCLVGVWVYCRFKKFDFGEVLDVLMPGMLLLIALGRWQDFFLCDGLGYPVETTALKFFPLATVTEAYFTDGTSVAYAVFFYEFVLCLALGAFAWRYLLRRNLENGDAAALTLFAFGVIANLMEYLREPTARQIVFFDLPFNALCSAILALAAFGYLVFGKRFPAIRKGLKAPRPADLPLAPDNGPDEPNAETPDAEPKPDEPNDEPNAEPKRDEPAEEESRDETKPAEPTPDADRNKNEQTEE